MRPVDERIKHWGEFYDPWPEERIANQGGRCMGCGVPFCHTGCPLGNLIPEFNRAVHDGRWHEALERLLATNNFPEFTGRICPAPCEAACVLSINDDPVTIEYIEKAIAERGYSEGWMTPRPPAARTGRKVAIVGSGPAGLAAADQLNCAGHSVTVFERDEVIGGLLRLGIPDFKLEKHIVQRRVDLMHAEGVEFKTGVHIGVDVPAEDLRRDFDALVLAAGATLARELDIPGHDLHGVHLAMPYLTQQNRINTGHEVPPNERITADGKDVVILGGGDTGSDCLGTAIRQGARRIYQFELLPEPPAERRRDNPWPYWPMVLRTSSSQAEGGARDYSILTKRFDGKDGKLERLHAVRLDWVVEDGADRPRMREIPDSEFELECQLVLLALGFVSPEPTGMLAELGVDLDGRGNVAVDGDMMTSVPGVFAAGDTARGQSLVVWAIALGREAARGVDAYLMGSSALPRSASTVAQYVGR